VTVDETVAPLEGEVIKTVGGVVSGGGGGPPGGVNASERETKHNKNNTPSENPPRIFMAFFLDIITLV
jgi:hypothetical protein